MSILGSIAPKTVDLGVKHVNSLIHISKKFDFGQIRTRHIVYVTLGTNYSCATYWYPDVKNNWNNVVGGLGRICINTPIPDQQTLDDFNKFTTIFYDHYFPDNVEIKNYDTYIESHRSYTLSQKKRFKLLRKKMETASSDQIFDSIKVSSFLKREAYPEEKKPRWINPRTDEFKAYFGDVISTLDDVIYECLHWLHVKHIDVRERSSKLKNLFGNDPVTTSDFRSWEACVKQQIMVISEVKLMLRVLSKSMNPQKLTMLIVALTGIQQCKSRCGVIFNTVAQRQSGELSTSGLNFLTDAMITLYSYYDQFYRHMSKKHYIVNCRSLVKALFEGDDGIHYCPQGTLSDDTYTRLGFLTKMEHHYSNNLASFCGQIYNPETLVMITDPIKFILKFGWVDSRYHGASAVTFNKLLSAKAYSYAYQYIQCPIIYPICHNLIKLTKCKPELFYLYKVIDPYHADKIQQIIELPNPKISLLDRNFMSKVFRIDADLQTTIENDLIRCGLGEWDCPLLNGFLDSKFLKYHELQVRYQHADYVEVDEFVQLH